MFQTLSVETQLLIFELISFAALIVILRRFAWKPIQEALHEREERIKNDVRAAEEARQMAEKLKADYARQLATVEKTSEEILERVGKEAVLLRAEMAESAKAETSRLLEKTRADMEEAEKELIRGLRISVTDASLNLAERLIRESLDEKTQQKFVDDAIERFQPCVTK